MSICETCNDGRFVTTKVDARRYTVDGGVSHVYPCPICGQFVLDGDGKKYGKSGRRYGNPNIRDYADYMAWKARNGPKLSGWHALPLLHSEESLFSQLQREFPGAKNEWIKAWVLGNRKVHIEEEPNDPDYDPRKDPAFMEQVAAERKQRIKTQAAVLDELEPEWWRRVKTNQPVELSDFQQNLVKEYERQKKVKAFLEEKQTP